MGYDFVMVRRKLASAERIEPRGRLNLGGMGLVEALLDELDLLDHDAKPVGSGSTGDDLDVFSSFGGGEPPDPAVLRWEAEQAVRFNSGAPASAVPAIKFSSNDGWLVFPAECVAIADALRSVSPETVQTVLEADPVEVNAIEDPDVQSPKDMAEAVHNVTEQARVFADYCDQAARFGGFRVF